MPNVLPTKQLQWKGPLRARLKQKESNIQAGKKMDIPSVPSEIELVHTSTHTSVIICSACLCL